MSWPVRRVIISNKASYFHWFALKFKQEKGHMQRPCIFQPHSRCHSAHHDVCPVQTWKELQWKNFKCYSCLLSSYLPSQQCCPNWKANPRPPCQDISRSRARIAGGNMHLSMRTNVTADTHGVLELRVRIQATNVPLHSQHDQDFRQEYCENNNALSLVRRATSLRDDLHILIMNIFKSEKNNRE